MQFIPLSSPDIRAEDIDAAVEVLKSGMLVQGKNVAALEDDIKLFTNSAFVKAVSNGTSTMHLALVALGVGKGDEVIVPAFSYVATANVVELVGATPVFIDIDERTFNIDVTKVESAITNKTKAIIPVHEFGLACDIEALMKIANKYQIPVIEDAACALGATQNGKYAGTFGLFGSFSLHPRKAITSGEGGLLLSSDARMDSKVAILRNHGIELQSSGKMEFVEAGFNYRMTDFQAALVRSQLKRLPAIIEQKNELSQVYFNELNMDLIQLPYVPSGRNHTWQTFHVLLKDQNRDAIIEKLKEKGIGSNYGAQCIPMQQYYRKKYDLDSNALFPNAVRAYQYGLALPLYEKLNKDQLSYISTTLNTILK